MPVRRLPDLTPEQVVRLQDALLENANTLLSSALTILDEGHVALARSLAILGLEESGKAIEVHERHTAMGYAADGEAFRCDRLDELWSSHEKKLETVHRFLVDERYWFGVEPSDPAENAAYLGTIKSWTRRNDRSKQRGFYVELGRTGEVLTPSDIADASALREVIARVHQIGWQLRLGEHIEGKRQDEKEHGSPAMTDEDLNWLDGPHDGDVDAGDFKVELRESLKAGVPGEPLPNVTYRFNLPDADENPFRNVGKPGYEAETRELLRLAREVERENPPE